MCKITVLLGLLCAAIAVADPSDRPGPNPAEPGLVTLHLKNQLPEAAFKALGEKIGVSIRGNGDRFWQRVNSESITRSWDDKPYWQVMKDLCRVAGVAPIESSRNQVVLMRQPLGAWARQPDTIAGPIQLTVAGVMAQHGGGLGRAARRTDTITLRLEMMCDPRVQPVSAGPLKVEQITDENGQPIRLAKVRRNPAAQTTALFSGRAQREVAIDASTQAHRIGHLKASLTVNVAGKVDHLEIPDVQNAKTVEKEVQGVKLSFTFQIIPGGARAKMTADGTGVSEEQWEKLRIAIVGVPPRLFDRNGHEYHWGGEGGGPHGDQGLDFSWNFAVPRIDVGKDTEAGKFVWDLPTSLIEVPVTLDVRNLPLQ